MKESIIYKILMFAVVILSAFTSSSNNQPVIIWASSPVSPNETVLIQGGNFSKEAKIELALLKDGPAGNAKSFSNHAGLKWTPTDILQRSESTLKFIIPSEWKMGIYACRISDGNRFSNTVFLNAPNVWWSQGDNGESSSPGGWLRIVGNCLNLNRDGAKKRKDLVALRNLQGEFFPLSLRSSDPFDIQALIPAKMATGSYELWVHNGSGGNSGWNQGGNVQVTAVLPPNAEVFNVKTLGIETALQKAKENGGGIVYFPSGEYRVMDVIEIPVNTVLKGDGKDKTIIYWRDLEKIPDALIHGKAFSIENLCLYCQNMYKNVIKVEDGNFKMDHVRIRSNPIFMLGRTKRESEFRGRKLNGEIEDIDASVHLSKVNHFEISNCDILAGSYGLRLMNSSNGLVRDSKVQYGRNGFGCEAISRVIIEDCIFEGIDLGASGNYSATYFGNSSDNLYLKGNRFANAYGLDREFFTFDGTGGAYFGHITTVSGNKMVLAKDPLFKRYAPNPTNWVNTAVCILKGKGIGQYRRVVKHSGRDWEVDKPWSVEPDETSILSIVPFRGRTLVVNNTFEDGGALQLYGMSIENIVSGNKGIRMNGFLAWGLNARLWGWQPSWYNQFLNNEIVEGNNYSHSPALISIMGNVDTMDKIKKNRDYSEKERTVFGEIWNHFEITPQMADCSLASCNLIRNNTIRNNGKIVVNGNTSDVIIEKNAISNSEFGIQLNQKPDCILLRLNSFEKVSQPITGEGKEKAVILTK